MSRTIKRILSLLLCAALLFGAAPLNGFVGLHFPTLNLPSFSSLFAVKARAEDSPTSGTCGDNLTWEYDEATATLTISGTGTMNSYNLNRIDPEDYSPRNDAPWQSYYKTMKTVVINSGVLSIGQGAFYACSMLTSLTIADGIESIGASAFFDCRGLTSVTIPNSVTAISHGAFYNCAGLTSLTIPTSVTSIDNVVFSNCTGLTSLTIPTSVMSIGSGAFSNCTGLTSLTIPSSIMSIGSGAFSGCSGLTSITVDENNAAFHSINNCLIETSSKTLVLGCKNSIIPIDGSVISIGDNAFYNCTELTNIVIPNSVTSIGDFAFNGCCGLTNVSIGLGALTIGNSAFYGCVGLTNLIIPDSVTSIGNFAFNGCRGLTSVSIGLGVLTIGNYAFSSCTGLTSISVPNSVTRIGECAFDYCTSLTNMSLPFIGASRTSSDSDGVLGYLFGSTSSSTSGTTRQFFGSGRSSYYFIPSSLREVTITDSNQLSYGAFYNCSFLTRVTIHNSVTSIGDYAFYGCTNLFKVTYTGSLEQWRAIAIGSSNNSLTNAIITYLGGGIDFGSCGKDLTWTYNLNTCVLTISGTGAMSGYSSSSYNGTSVTTAPWRSYYQSIKTVVIEDGVTSIGANAFYGCSELASVTIGNSVTSIGNRAFYNCTGLTEIYYNAVSVTGLSSTSYVFSGAGTAETGVVVTFGDSVETIPAYLFNNCSELTSVTIGNNVTSIGASAFGGCTGLTSVTIPDSVMSIGSYAFSNCTGLTSVTIGRGVESIGASAFNGCTGLTTAGPIGGGYDYEFGWTNSIPSNAFYGCSSLTSVVIPDSITGIGENAFNYCTDLTKVNITDLSVWCSISFSYSSNPLRYAHNLYLNDVLVTDLVIPDSVTSIGNYAFCSCTGLTSVTIPDSVTSIGISAFNECTSLSTVYYNAVSVNSDVSPFSGVSSLKTVVVGEGVEALPANLFRGAENLEQVILPRSVKTISKTFLDANCDAIVYCPKGSYAQTCCIRYGWVYGLLDSSSSPEFIIANGALLHYVGSKAQVLLPQVDTIGAGALNGNTQVVSVEISSATSEIFDEAFANCSVLQRVVIPSSVTFISGYAFADSDNVVIYCVEGSYAQQFAMSNGIPYELITVTFNRPEVVLRPNQTLQLNAVYSVALCETDLLWQSDNEDVVTVDHNGLVTAVGNGRAIITAANENGLTVQCVVGVTDSDFSLQQTKGELDASTNLLYGLHAGVTADELKNEYFTTNGTCRLDCEGMLATGDKVSLIETTTGVKAAEYTVVIFGDVDGSGWYDGTDAYFVSLVANGLIPASALTEAQRMAADANHDGNIDVADVALLEQAGLLLNDIDQTAPQEELETNSVYLEYCGLIDQSIEILEPVQPTQAEETPAAQSILGWLNALFAFVLNWLLRIF